MDNYSIVNIMIPKMKFRYSTLRHITNAILDKGGLTGWDIDLISSSDMYIFYADIGPDTLVHAIRQLADNFLMTVYFDEPNRMVRFEPNLLYYEGNSEDTPDV